MYSLYAGVGYGKKLAKTKHIGFSSPEERRNFEAGIQKQGEHFNSYRGELTFFEKAFNRRENPKSSINYRAKPLRKHKRHKSRAPKSRRSKR